MRLACFKPNLYLLLIPAIYFFPSTASAVQADKSEDAGRSGLNPQMMNIKGGCFQIGSPQTEQDRDDDENSHQVCVDDFKICKYEVTVGEFKRFVKATSYTTDAERNVGGKTGCRSVKNDKWAWVTGHYWDNVGFSQSDHHPVSCVSWNDAMAYIQWLNKMAGGGYRLPTEAEWEYSARSGETSGRFWSSNQYNACQFANVGNQAYWDGTYPCDDGYKWAAPVGTYRPNAFGFI